MNKNGRTYTIIGAIGFGIYSLILFSGLISDIILCNNFFEWRNFDSFLRDATYTLSSLLALVAFLGIIIAFLSAFIKKLNGKIGWIIILSALLLIYAIFGTYHFVEFVKFRLTELHFYQIYAYFSEVIIFTAGIILIVISIKNPKSKILNLWKFIPGMMLAVSVDSVVLCPINIFRLFLNYYMARGLGVAFIILPLTIGMVMIGELLSYGNKTEE